MKTSQLDVQGNTLFVKGILSFDTVAQLYPASLTLLGNKPDWVIDLSAVEHSDSSGLALVLAWLRHAKNHFWKVQLVNLPEQILSFAHICEVDKLLEDKHG